MQKHFTGATREAAEKKAEAWVIAKGAAIRGVRYGAATVRRDAPKTGTSKDAGEWTFTVEYEPSS